MSVSALRGALYRSTLQVTGLQKALYSNSRVGVLRHGRYAATRRTTTRRQGRYTSVDQATVNAWQTNDGELSVSIIVDVEGTLHDLTGVPTVLQETQGENQPAKWQLSIQDDTGQYHPDRVGGAWEGVMNSEAFGTGGSYRKILRFGANWEGYPYSLEGVPTNYGHSRSFSSGGRFDFSWGGVDISRKLFLPGQTFPTLRTERGVQTWTTKKALADLLDRVGIPYDLSRMEDAPIRLQHRQDGRPGDFMQQLCDVLYTKWCVQDGRLVFWQPAYVGPPHWDYPADALIPEDNLNVDAPEVWNKVTVRRAAESKSRPIMELHNFGQYTQTFNPPLGYLTYRLLSGGENGVVSDLYLKNQAGLVIEVRESRNGGTLSPTLTTLAPIASVTFTWGVKSVISGGDGWPGTIQFSGQEMDSAALAEEYDPVFSITETNSASIDKYGEHAIELAPNPLLFSEAAMRRQAQYFLQENSGLLKPQTFRLPLNHGIRPGHRIRISDQRLNRSDIRYIRQRSHSWSDDPDQRFTRIDTVLYA